MADAEGLSPEDAAAARAAEQARIRKERREAKIRAGGSARLNKITGLGGGVQRDPVPSSQPSTAPTSPPTAAASAEQQQQPQHHADPDEVDISNSEHYYRPETTNRVPTADLSDTQLRQMMLGFDPATTSSASPNSANNPFAAMMGMGNLPGGEGGAPDPNDPMMKMLSQMMGAGGGGGGGAQNPFAAMAAAGGGGPAAQQPAAAAAPSTSTAIWRVLHFLVAIGLGLYVALLTNFTGTKLERERAAFAHTTAAPPPPATSDAGVAPDLLRTYFFWAFATAESVLLTSRWFLDKGARGPAAAGGVVAMVLGFVPDGMWKSLVVNGLRYSQIFSTVRMDMLVCVFVLGVCSLLRA